VALSLIATGLRARDVWRRVLALDETAVASQTPEWMDATCMAGGYQDVTRAYTTGDGHLLVLPLARSRLPGAAGVAGSMPFGWGTGGLLSSRGNPSSDDVHDIVADLVRQRAGLIAVRPSPSTEAIWSAAVPSGVARTHHMSQTVDLSGGFDAVWRDFAATVRSHCRKAERRGVTVERDNTGRLMPVFDVLYRKSVDRWASQQHEPVWLARWRATRRDPPHKFETVARHLGPACRVWVAWRANEALAALVLLTHGRQTTMWRAAMDKEAARGTGATELLHRVAIEEACRSGQRFYHLGDSAPSSELARYKRGFGAREWHYTGYRFERLPLTAIDQLIRRQVKRVIGFRD
jgi:Acetyltransferase (GNAT) domain